MKTHKILYVIVLLGMTSCTVSNESYVKFSDGVMVINDKTTTPDLRGTDTVEWSLGEMHRADVLSYEVCLGTSYGQCNIVDWVDVGTATTYKFNQTLNSNSQYVVNVRYNKRSTSQKSIIFSSTGLTTPSNRVETVALGGDHTCALSIRGDVKCWGSNTYGELGYDDTNHRGDNAGEMAALAHVNLGVGRTAKQIGAGWDHTCAILDNDKLKCWGRNSYGQLGYDDTNHRGDSAGEMASLGYVELGTDKPKKLAVAGNGTCVILDNDKLKCWGINGFGQLGYEHLNSIGDNPGELAALGYINLGTGRTAKDVDNSAFHTCVLLDNDQVKCWGRNSAGMLGYDDIVNRGGNPGDMSVLPYVNLGAGRTAKQLNVSAGGVCVILDNDKLKCWGSNSSGQLGYDDTNHRGDSVGEMAALGYVDIGSGRTIKKFSNFSASCVILDNNQLKCWGGNGLGQLGYDDHTNRGGNVGDMASLANINLGVGRYGKQIFTAKNGSQVCAILDTDQLKCWGGNSVGQLGYDDTTARGGLTRSITADGANLYTP